MEVLHIVRHKLPSEIWIHSFYSWFFSLLSDAGLDIESTCHVLVRKKSNVKKTSVGDEDSKNLGL